MSSKVSTTRDRILTAARVLLEDGEFDVGMGDIAREAGISRQAVYLHFPSKADLLRQLTTWVEEQAQLGSLLAPVFDASDGETALKALLHAGAVFEPQIHALARATEQIRDRDDQVRAINADRMARRLAGMTTIVARIEAEGRLKPGWDIDTAAAFVWLTTSPASYHAMVVELGWTPDAWAEATFHLLCDAFITPHRTRE
jgi:AcrR family transcriptional regulator